MRVSPVYLLLLFSIALSSCVKKPVFINIENVKVVSLQDSTLKAQIDFKVYNPNGVKVSIIESKINTYYKNILVGSSTLDKELSLRSKDTVIVPLISEINLWNLAKVFPELLATDTVSFRIEGSNKVKSLGISLNIPLKDNIKLDIRKAMITQMNKTFQSDSNFRIKDLKLSRMPGISKTGLQMTVDIKNSFPFDYRITRIHLDVYRKNGNRAIANWKLTDTIEQKAGARSSIPLKIEIDNLKLLSEARLSDVFMPGFDVVLKGEAEVYIQGRRFMIPIEEQRKLPINLLSESKF